MEDMLKTGGHILKRVCRQSTLKEFKQKRKREEGGSKEEEEEICARPLHRKLQNVVKFHFITHYWKDSNPSF